VKITPKCDVATDYGYPIVYSISSTTVVPKFLTVNDDGSVDLPSKFEFVYPQSFYIYFECSIPSVGSSVKPVVFAANGLLMPTQKTKPDCKGDCDKSGRTNNDPHIYDFDGYYVGDTFFFFDFEKKPYNETLYDWQVATRNFVPTGQGPYLVNILTNKNETTSYFKVDYKKGFDWTYTYGDRVGRDTIS